MFHFSGTIFTPKPAELVMQRRIVLELVDTGFDFLSWLGVF